MNILKESMKNVENFFPKNIKIEHDLYNYDGESILFISSDNNGCKWLFYIMSDFNMGQWFLVSQITERDIDRLENCEYTIDRLLVKHNNYILHVSKDESLLWLIKEEDIPKDNRPMKDVYLYLKKEEA